MDTGALAGANAPFGHRVSKDGRSWRSGGGLKTKTTTIVENRGRCAILETDFDVFALGAFGFEKFLLRHANHAGDDAGREGDDAGIDG